MKIETEHKPPVSASEIIRNMQTGDSVLVDALDFKLVQAMRMAASRNGMSLRTQKYEDGSVRVWRVQ